MSYSKILKAALLTIVSLLIILFSASLILQERVTGIIIDSLNRNFATKLETGSYRLSLIRKFPRASVELKNVLVHSSPGFDRSGFKGINTDTLLAARSANLDFKISDIFRGDYTFTRITIKNGRLNLFTDTGRSTNFEVVPRNRKNGNSAFSLNLNRINLSDVRVLYHDTDARLIIDGFIRNGKIRSILTGNDIEFDSESDIILNHFQLRNFAVRSRVPAYLRAGINRNKKGVFFRKGILTIDRQDIKLTGYIAADNFLDLKVVGENLDISKISGYLPAGLREKAGSYNPTGTLSFHSTIKGISSRKLNPHYEVGWSLRDSRIENTQSKLKIDDFTLEGSYSNGAGNRSETSVLRISDFQSRLGSAKYSGSFEVTDFSAPVATLSLHGTLYPGELKEYLNIAAIKEASGTVDLDINLSGRMVKKDKYRIADLLSLDSRSELNFRSFSLIMANRKTSIENGNGTVVLTGKTTVARDLLFKYNGQSIALSGEFQNLPDWLAGQPVNLTGSAVLEADRIETGLFKDSSDPQSEKGTGRTSVKFPGDVFLDLNFSVDEFIFRKFTASRLKGTLNYKPKMLNFKSVALETQGGSLSGNALIIQNQNKSFMARGSFSLDGIDINSAFLTFNNFGQSFIKAENLAGFVSGTVSLLIPADSLLNPDKRSVTADGKYIITNGELRNFEPVKALSKFIEVSELENISFDRLENDFFIRNNALSIPQMDVRSSAVDLSVNGRHSFDNNYEYHVKMLLSEILSKKADKKRQSSSEFGEIEDDGLGRTSMYLKIAGKGEEVKVSYDMQAAGNQIKEDIKKERQTLKNILNEEYGWYKTDTPASGKTTTKPRFRISWEGSDTLNTETQSTPAPKSGIIKKLFKKK